MCSRRLNNPTTQEPNNSSSQPPVRIQMPQRPRLVAAALEDSGQVVVRVSIRWIELDRLLIRLGRFVQTAEVFECDAEVEPGDIVVGIGFECRTILLLRG